MQKREVRQHAERLGLPNRARKDSQGICFLGKLKFDEFIAHYLGKAPGDVRCRVTKESLGTHRGLWYHTVGQRKGIGLLLKAGVVNKGPWYVSAKDPVANVLYVTNDLDTVEKPRREFSVEGLNWINGCPFGSYESVNSKGEVGEMLMDVRLRHGPAIASGRVREVVNGDTRELWVVLDEKDKGIAPGQFAAFYEKGGKVCLGAGVISGTSQDDPVGLEL